MDFWFRSNLSRIIFFTVNFLLFFDQNHPWKCIGKNWNTKTSTNFVTFCPFLNSLQPIDPEKPHQTPPKLILKYGMKSSLWPFYVYGTLNLVDWGLIGDWEIDFSLSTDSSQNCLTLYLSLITSRFNAQGTINHNKRFTVSWIFISQFDRGLWFGVVHSLWTSHFIVFMF